MIPPSLDALMPTGAATRALLEGSCIETDLTDPDVLFEAWRASREFIASAIRSSGTLLDYGCANGLLLRCLIEWSEHRLEPYGVEIDRARLAQTAELFPGLAGRFARPEDWALAGLPDLFDHVYWAVGDNVDLSRPDHRRWLDSVAGRVAPGGRLILGFYADHSANEDRLRQLLAAAPGDWTVRWNPDTGVEVIAWTDPVRAVPLRP